MRPNPERRAGTRKPGAMAMGRGDILGGMAFEPNYEMLRRLQETYGEMSDRELLDLAAKPEDLTDVAREALHGELAHRGIKPEETGPQDDPGTASALPKPEFGTKLPDGSVVLIRLYDSMATSEACDCLEAEGIDVTVRDVSEPGAGGSFYGGPPVALELIVPGKDRDRSVKILREKRGLFPLQEVEEADPTVDDGTVATLGDFARKEDAAEFEKVLDEARIWHRIVANDDGSVEDENAFRLEVREVDLFKAGELVEKALG